MRLSESIIRWILANDEWHLCISGTQDPHLHIHRWTDEPYNTASKIHSSSSVSGFWEIVYRNQLDFPLGKFERYFECMIQCWHWGSNSNPITTSISKANIPWSKYYILPQSAWSDPGTGLIFTNTLHCARPAAMISLLYQNGSCPKLFRADLILTWLEP